MSTGVNNYLGLQVGVDNHQAIIQLRDASTSFQFATITYLIYRLFVMRATLS